MTPTELYALVGALLMAVIVLAGLWIRAHDTHRQWSTAKITEHERVIAILETEFRGVRSDVSDIKQMLEAHTHVDRRFQAAVAQKLGVQFEVE